MERTFELVFEEQNNDICLDFGEFNTIRSLDYYEGDYEVTPRVVPQILQTSQKAMKRNLTVLEIPKIETSNPQGGYTCNIG